jgi:hypothetical protein
MFPAAVAAQIDDPADDVGGVARADALWIDAAKSSEPVPENAAIRTYPTSAGMSGSGTVGTPHPLGNVGLPIVAAFPAAGW